MRNGIGAEEATASYVRVSLLEGSLNKGDGARRK
jgi:hypothetical protein